MRSFDKKAQMLDAGMVMFESDKSFGIMIGSVRNMMSEYGHAYKANELNPDSLPVSTGECDIFLDYSTIWRKRYISCKIESAGENRYAALFKEGNRSTALRGWAHIAIILCCIAAVAVPANVAWYSIVSACCISAATVYGWIYPSRKAQRTVREIRKRLE